MSWSTTTRPPESTRFLSVSIADFGSKLLIWFGFPRVSFSKTSISSWEAAIAWSQVVPMTQAKRTWPSTTQRSRSISFFLRPGNFSGESPRG